jgi:hypothetical protein
MEGIVYVNWVSPLGNVTPIYVYGENGEILREIPHLFVWNTDRKYLVDMLYEINVEEQCGLYIYVPTDLTKRIVNNG